MNYTFKKRKSNEETSEEWTSRNLIEAIRSLENFTPFMIIFDLSPLCESYSTLSSKDAHFKINIRTLNTAYLKLFRHSNYSDYFYLQNHDFSLKSIDIENVANSLNKELPDWIPFGYCNSTKNHWIDFKNPNKSFVIINLKNILEYKIDTLFNVCLLGAESINFLPITHDYSYLDYDMIEGIRLDIGVSFNLYSTNVTFAFLKDIKFSLEKLIKSDTLSQRGKFKAEKLISKINMILKNYKNIASIRSAYTDIFAKEIIRLSSNIIRLEKSKNTSEKRLKEISEEVENISLADRLLLEVSNISESDI